MYIMTEKVSNLMTHLGCVILLDAAGWPLHLWRGSCGTDHPAGEGMAPCLMMIITAAHGTGNGERQC